MQLENITDCKLAQSVVTGINWEIDTINFTSINSLLMKPVTQGEISNTIKKS